MIFLEKIKKISKLKKKLLEASPTFTENCQFIFVYENHLKNEKKENAFFFCNLLIFIDF